MGMTNYKKGVVVLAVFLAIALTAYADQIGCCVNPFAPDPVKCSSNMISDSLCCPANDSQYYTPNAIYGPGDMAECMNDYFAGNQSCDINPDCATGCCCMSSGDVRSTKAGCYAQGSTFMPGDSDCETCDNAPECNDGIDNNNNQCIDYVSGDEGCDSANDTTEDSGANCPSTQAGCGAASYKPKITSLQESLTKGVKKVSLTWVDECSADYYKISRCKGSACTDFTQIATTTSKSYTDSAQQLLFDTDYTYLVRGSYRLQGDGTSAQKSVNLGNLECWGKTDNSQFCIHKAYYYTFKSYILANYAGVTQGNFDSKLSALFGSKFNSAYSCNNYNMLAHAGLTCNSSAICVTNGNAPSCITGGNCNYPLANPFGLYYSENECQTNKFCFFDRSFTVVENCYDCNVNMSCYDYKSEDSCMTDNCNAGGCEWHELATELNTGVCVKINSDNCKWCGGSGSGVGTSRAASRVFEGCSPTTAQKLSVPGYKCIYANGTALSCRKAVCTDYGATDCGSAQIVLNRKNEITNPSSDPCGIGACQNINGECRKNADGDSAKDCTSAACEADHYKPTTLIGVSYESGLAKKLHVNILDNISSESGEEIINDPSYKTYLSLSTSEAHPFNAVTASYEMVISGLGLFDLNGVRMLNLTQGLNSLRYYSSDKSNNLGIVQNMTIFADRNSSSPYIINFSVQGAKVVNGAYYTANKKPKITAIFLEDAYVTSASLISSGNTYTRPNFQDVFAKEFEFTFSNNIPEGQYTFEVSAKNENNRVMQQFTKNIVIDSMAGNVSFSPAYGEFLGVQSVNMVVTFSEPANITSLKINNIEHKDDFAASQGNRVFSASLTFADGRQTVELTAADYAGNLVVANSYFTINKDKKPVITLKRPKYGVASQYTFDLEVGTDNDAYCKYSLQNSNSQPQIDYSLMSTFDSSNNITHMKRSFSQIAGGSTKTYYLYVVCNDTYYGEGSSKLIPLSVDTTAPTFDNAYAFPNPLLEQPLETQLSLKTNEDTVCRFDEQNKVFAEMANEFSGYPDNFSTTHTAKVTSLPSSGSKTYYSACQNMAGLSSANRAVTISVDLSAGLVIKDNTNRYSKAATITLAVETNKKAQCQYSEEPAFTSGTLFGAMGYAHIKDVALAPGTYTFYVQCKSPGMTGWSSSISIPVTIDMTAPVMEYVNDSSKMDDLEYTWETRRLQVKWNALENETSVWKYNYTIEEYGTLSTIVNWTESTKNGEWFYVTGLNLSDGAKYYFRVKALNVVGLSSDSMNSDGISIDTSKKPSTCQDGEKGALETDVDCGGQCSQCADGKKCDSGSDCLNGYCKDKICTMPTCNDNAENGHETDADCGGACKKCDDGSKCLQSADCKSSNCEGGICRANTCSNSIMDGTEADTDCGGACPSRCSLGKNCNSDSDCEASAKCISSKCTDCPSYDQNCDGIDDDREKDMDGDGMDDEWEVEYDFDTSNPADADEDSDNDGLTNKQEFEMGTNPLDADTDMDGSSDGKESKAGTDPLDEMSRPGSKLWIILLLILAGCLAGLGGFYAYHVVKSNNERESRKASQRPIFGQVGAQRPVIMQRPLHQQPNAQSAPEARQAEEQKLKKKREEQDKATREKVFNAFGKLKEEKEDLDSQASAKETEKPANEKKKERLTEQAKPAEQKEKPKAKAAPEKPVPFQKGKPNKGLKEDMFKKLKRESDEIKK